MNSTFSSIDVQELLPQRRPYIFVDALLDYQEGQARSQYTVTPSTYFVENASTDSPQASYMPVSGLIENMAQTCALKIGYYHKYILHEPVRIGYLAGVKTFRLHQLPTVGQTIYTQIDVLYEVCPMSMVKAVIELADHTLLAEATVQIVETPDNVIPMPGGHQNA